MIPLPSHPDRARSVIRSRQKKKHFTGEKPSVMLYGGLALAGLLKDLLDFAGIGMIPGLSLILAACLNSFIFLMLLVFDRSGGRQNRKVMQGLIIIFLVLIEGVAFGLNFLPIQSLTMVGLYAMAKRAWKKEKEIFDIAQAKEMKVLSVQAAADRRTRARMSNAEVVQY